MKLPITAQLSSAQLSFKPDSVCTSTFRRIGRGISRAIGIVLFSALVTACGGGGGGGSPRTGMNVLDSFAGSEDAATAARNAGAVAPRPGSVIQLANGNAVDSTTLLEIEPEVSGSGAVFEVRIDRDASGPNPPEVLRTDAPDVEVVEPPLDDEVVEDGIEEGFHIVAAVRESGNEALGVVLFTDIERADDTDWMAGGIWLHAEDTESGDPSDWEVGAFADFGTLFPYGAIEPLTGTAEYAGFATGIALGDEDYSYTFAGLVALTAEFGTNSQLGTIHGQIDFLDENGYMDLDRADIGNINSDDGGFFTGTTTLYEGGTRVNEDDPYTGGSPLGTGHWGGQFTGTGASGAYPTGVGGTFGASGTVPADPDDPDSGGTFGLVGVFAAYPE